MADESRPGKRKDLTPESKQEKEKVIKQYESITQHPSILNAADLQTSPVSTRSPSLNIVKKCELAGISEAGGKLDIETIYKLVIDLSARVSTLEGDIEKKDEEIFKLRKDHADLEKQFNDLRKKEKTNSDDDVQFLEVVRKELPTLSDHVAKNETEIGKIKVDVNKLSDDVKSLEEDSIDNNQAPNNLEVQSIISAQKEDREKFIQEIRKNHLEGDHRDQYTMRDSIRVTGVPYKAGEDTSDLICRIAYSIGVTITRSDISVSHRTGKRIAGRPRAIICKFTRRETKYRILQNKKFARNINNDDDGNPVSIYIDEKLTPMRANVCRLLREEKIKHHTKDGKIFIPKDNDSEWIVLDTVEDWFKWDKSDNIKMNLGVYPKF